MRFASLKKFERRWARVLFSAIVPGGLHEDVPEGAGDLGAVDTLNDLYTRSSVLGAIGFRGGLWLCWFLPLFVVGRFRTFGGLTVEQRDAFLQKLYIHRAYTLRQLLFLMRMVACTGYFRDTSARKAFNVYYSDAVDLALPVVQNVERSKVEV